MGERVGDQVRSMRVCGETSCLFLLLVCVDGRQALLVYPLLVGKGAVRVTTVGHGLNKERKKGHVMEELDGDIVKITWEENTGYRKADTTNACGTSSSRISNESSG